VAWKDADIAVLAGNFGELGALVEDEFSGVTISI